MKEQLKTLHHFPGHMKRAFVELNKMASLCDVLIELVDARAPLATSNIMFKEVGKNKPRLLILTKDDLADANITRRWINYFKNNGQPVLAFDNRKKALIKTLNEALEEVAKTKREKEARLGMKPQALRLAIFGIPNVGKSTLINTLVGHKSAKAENRPGVTRAQQWLKINKDYVLLDTPGILPMGSTDEDDLLHLAYIGSIKDQVIPVYELTVSLINLLIEHYPERLKERYEIEDLSSPDALLTALAQSRGLLKKEGKVELQKAALAFLKDFRSGALGRISLQVPNA